MARVVVYHRFYGCDTGCCGHVVEVDGVQVGDFDFSHPQDASPEQFRKYARDLVTEQFGAEHVEDLDWTHCRIELD